MRKEMAWVVDGENRDKGKEFLITEMSAWDAEELAQDIYRAMGEAGISEISSDVIAMGCAGLATLGLSVLSASPADVSRQISRRLLDTVQIRTESGLRKPIIDDYEEVSTIRTLKDKVFELNFSFLTTAAR